jgi:hypothetical protein
MDPLKSAQNRPSSFTKGEHANGRSPTQQGSYVVPAIIISKPYLSLYTTIQNLLNYCLECINSFIKESSDHKGLGDHFEQCVTHIDSLRTSRASALDVESRRLLDEYLEEAKHVVNIIRSFVDNSKQGIDDVESQPVGLLLAAKASHLQWLTVCILEELRKPFNGT